MTTNKFQSLAQRALSLKTSGAAAVATAQQGSAISDDAMAAMREMASLDKETAKALSELAGARKDINENAFAFRDWLRAGIKKLSSQEKPDPTEVVALMSAASSTELENGQLALPLFKMLPLGKAPKPPASLYVPRAERKDGAIVVRGLIALVPENPGDEECLRILRVARAKAAEALVEWIEGESLIDLRRPIWNALHLMERATIWRKAQVEELFENGQEDLLVRKKDGRQFAYYQLSNREFFVVEDSPLAQRFVKQLSVLNGFARQFWQGEVDIEVDIQSAVEENREHVISPADFLRGLPGICAVVHDKWKLRKDSADTARVVVLFDRPVGQNKWRWVMANRAAARSCFGGGELRFHELTAEEIPPHIVVLLRRGQSLA